MRKRNLVGLLLALLLTSLLSGQGLTVNVGGEDIAVQPQTCRYSYDLVQRETQPGERAKFDLYIVRTKQSGALLHTGSITLAIPRTEGETQPPKDRLSFRMEPGWDLMGMWYPAGMINTANYGTVPGSGDYISFLWTWAANQTSETTVYLGENGGKQHLGVLEVPEGVELEDIQLLPWPVTEVGGKVMADWAADKSEAHRMLYEDIWRILDPEGSYINGFYQGFYEWADDGEHIQGVYRTNIGCLWQNFTIGAYAPRRPVTLHIYKVADGEKTKVAAAQYEFHTTQDSGHFSGQIDFDSLELNWEDGIAVEDRRLDGDYELVIEKQSHVKATMEGLTAAADDIFPELTGRYVELPCGDIDASGRIRQYDRALLTVPGRYGRAMGSNEEKYDLNGDERIDQIDLSILIAPANYGKSDFKIPK